MTTADGDLIVQAQRVESPDDISVGFWMGEPHTCMKGYRFITPADAVQEFTRDLQADEDRLEPPVRIP